MQIAADSLFEFNGAAVSVAANLSLGERCEPALDLIEPRARGGLSLESLVYAGISRAQKCSRILRYYAPKLTGGRNDPITYIGLYREI